MFWDMKYSLQLGRLQLEIATMDRIAKEEKLWKWKTLKMQNIFLEN